jgi:ABC-type spermidine/putrescine transport system permease subunit II
MLATIVDWKTLGEVALYSLVVAVGATAAFSLAILGAARMVEMRRAGRQVESGAYATLMILGLLVSGAAVVFGVIVMTTKG